MTEELRIPAAMMREMIEHALVERPLESCGLVAGRAGRPLRFYPTRNADQSPVRYSIHPEDLLHATLDIERRCEDLWAIFHSHPQSEAYPSHTDIRLAFYPESIYLIASLLHPEQPVLRGYRILGQDVRELAIRFE